MSTSALGIGPLMSTSTANQINPINFIALAYNTVNQCGPQIPWAQQASCSTSADTGVRNTLKLIIYQGPQQTTILRRYWDRTIPFIRNYYGETQHLLRPNTSVLDCRCGPGSITRSFKEICTDGNVIGIDQDPDAIEYAWRQGGGAKFMTGNIDSLPFADDTFDVVYSHQVFQYVEDPVKCLVELKRVCKRGGVVAIRVCDHEGTFWYPDHSGIQGCMDLFKEANSFTGGDVARARKMGHLTLLAGFKHVKKTASVHYWGTQEERKHWADRWVGMFVTGKLKRVCEEHGLLKENSVKDITEGFKRFEEDEGGILVFPEIEIVCSKSACK